MVQNIFFILNFFLNYISFEVLYYEVLLYICIVVGLRIMYM